MTVKMSFCLLIIISILSFMRIMAMLKPACCGFGMKKGRLSLVFDRVLIMGSILGMSWMLGSGFCQASIFIGLSEKDVTPSTPQILAGYGTSFLTESSLRMSEGVHDPLKVGAIALRELGSPTLVLVSVDAVGVSPAMILRLKRASRSCGVESLFVSATHTHHAPDVVGLWGALPKTGRNQNYVNFFEAKIIEAICEATSHMVKGKILLGQSQLSPTSALGQPDSLLTHLQFLSIEGKELGTLTQWNAHPATMTFKNKMISADFPGSFRKLMNRRSPEGVHVYFSGTLGGSYVSTHLPQDQDLFPHSPKSQGEERLNYLRMSGQGTLIFDKLKGLKLDTLNSIPMKTVTLKANLDNHNLAFGLAFALKVLEERPEFTAHSNSDAIETSMSLIALGSLAIATVPGEVFPEISYEIRQALYDSGFKTTMIFGITNDWLGYIIHPDHYQDDQLKYYRTLSVGKQIGQLSLDAFRGIAFH